jgi:hypothetical protein
VSTGPDVGIGQQPGAGRGGKAIAQQEIAIAVHDADAQPGIAGGTQRGDDLGVERVAAVVVADPGFEEVAENIEFLGLAGAAGKKPEEQTRRPGRPGRQVQVGDEEDQTTSAFSMITSSTGTS